MKIKDVLRLKVDVGLSHRPIGIRLGISHSTVAGSLRRAAQAGIGGPLPEPLSETELEPALFVEPHRGAGPTPARASPDWPEIHQPLKRTGVTRRRLWQAYKEPPGAAGDQYRQFSHHYRQWRGTLEALMRQTHPAGEKLFVEYAGQPGAVIDRPTGELRLAEIFGAGLGASGYTDAEATWTQTVPDGSSAHIRACAFFQGCPAVLVPDHLKSAVTGAQRYDPDLNRNYAEMARYYGGAVVPPASEHPRTKAIH